MKYRLWAAFIVLLLVAGCATEIPRGMRESTAIMEAAVNEGDDRLLPDEFGSFSRLYENGKDLLQKGEDEEAQEAFVLAWMKGEMLLKDGAAARLRQAEDERKAAEARERELDRQRKLEAEKARELEEREREESRRKAEKARIAKEKEKALAPTHTVRRGETLPQIAQHPDVYGDSTLWPLLYRANRDQIKDPKSISAGQVLKIPRSVTKEEAAEARRYSQEHPL